MRRNRVVGRGYMTGLAGAMLSFFVMLDASAAEVLENMYSTSKISNRYSYDFDLCVVYDSTDMFTDEVSHHLIMSESADGFRPPEVRFSSYSDGSVMIQLFTVTQIIAADMVDILIRVDKGNLRKERWRWSPNGSEAYSYDAELFSALLTEIASGKRWVFKVGHQGGNIRLNGCKLAVDDFKVRIA